MKYVDPDDAYDYFLATLSNKNRIKILNALLGGEKTVSELTNKIGINQSTISNNLSRLKSCGFVTVRPDGKERYYKLNKETALPLMKLINFHVKKYCVNCIRGNSR